MSKFQLIFTGLLLLLGVGGMVLFAVAKNQGSASAPEVVMWGTIPNTLMSNFISKANMDNRGTLNVSYVEKNPVTFETELVSALASGTGPDLILLPQDLIVRQINKFYPVPFSSYSERTFKDSFIQEGELYLNSNGIIGFPFSIDPMVMYWNRDLFSNAGVSQPPVSWSEFFTLAPEFIKKDSNDNILQSFVAFGEVSNVIHAKDMIALLAMQAGTPIIGLDSSNQFTSVFDMSNGGLVPAEEAVSFFTEFSNPVKTSYSWNRSLITDRNAFLAGKLAVYFGYASELPSLRTANPNLNFDVAMMPQTSGNKITFGKMNAIAILKSSKNIAAAYTAAAVLTSSTLANEWVNESGFPPVRRDLLTTIPGDAYQAIFYNSALISKSWLDPYSEATDGTFTRLIENVTSGKLRVSESVHTASLELDNILKSNI